MYTFLSRVMRLDVNTDKKLAPMTLIYAIIMFKRCKELSRVADRGRCKSGDTLFSSKDNVLNNIIIDVFLGSVHSY